MNLARKDARALAAQVNSRTVFFVGCLTLVLSFAPVFCLAKQEARPVAEDPEIEQRMHALTEDLRCLVCQNETIAESRADFSNDMRREIREQIKANKTDEEIIEFLVDRYGDFVLSNPPFKSTTVMLWLGPIIFFLLGSITLYVYLRRRRLQVDTVEVPMSEAERKQVEALLNDDKGNQV